MFMNERNNEAEKSADDGIRRVRGVGLVSHHATGWYFPETVAGFAVSPSEIPRRPMLERDELVKVATNGIKRSRRRWRG